MKLIFLFLIVSCSRFNLSSQDYYNKKHMRHGIIPLSTTALKTGDNSTVLRGKDLYEKNCLSCHGVSGMGDGPEVKNLKEKPINLKKLVRDVPNFSFFMSISQWQGDMPGWKEPFTEKERAALVAYIKSFRK